MAARPRRGLMYHRIGRRTNGRDSRGRTRTAQPERSRRQRARVLGLRARAAPSSARWRRASATCACAGRSRASAARTPPATAISALKDDKAKIEAVIWRTHRAARLKVQAGGGHGGRSPPGASRRYPGSSNYQIVIEALEPAGIGALMALLEERKKKLAAEGLFEEARKKPRAVPAARRSASSPRRPAPSSATCCTASPSASRRACWCGRCACRARPARPRWPPRSRGFNAFAARRPHSPRPDVLIVARGGGSLEDLWGFNEEIVVRAVGRQPHPAHLRRRPRDRLDADRPCRRRARADAHQGRRMGGAEVRRARREHGEARRAPDTAARRVARRARTHLQAAARGLPRLEDLLALPRQRFDACERRLGRALLANTRAHHTRYVRTASRLRPGANSPAHCNLRRAHTHGASTLRHRHCSTGSPRDATGSKARASCSLRSATKAFCSAASRSSAIATGAWCARQRTVHAGERARIGVPRRPRRCRERSVRSGTGVKDSGGPASASAAEPARATHAGSARQRPRIVVLRLPF